MNIETINNNRLLKNIEKVLNQGHRLIIITGETIDDLFFTDFESGAQDIDELIPNYLRSYYKIDDILHLNESNVISKPEETKPAVERDCEGFDETDEVKSENNNEAGSNSQKKEAVSIINLLKSFQSIVLKNVNKKYALIINNYDWLAKFYNSDSEETTAYFNELRKIGQLSNSLAFIIQKNTSRFPQYNYKIESPNYITIGKPDSDEIAASFLHKYLKNYGDIHINNFKHIFDISSALCSANISIRQLYNILDDTLVKLECIDIDAFKHVLAKPIQETVSDEDIILDSKIKLRIENSLKAFLDKADDKFKKGIILTGPPGTGKTHIARGIANQNKCYFMSIKLSDVKGQFIGESGQKVRAIFNEARSNEPTIMFVDEIDTVLPARASTFNNDSDSFTKDIVNEFLVNIDGAGTQKDRIFIIGATNRPNVIDPAIKSRLSDIIEISLPEKKERKQIFEKNLENINLHEFSDWFDEFLDKTEGFSGRDIKNFCNSISERKCEITKRVFYEELEKVENQMIDELRNKAQIEIIKYKPSNKSKTFDSIIGYDDKKEEIRDELVVPFLAGEDKKKAENLDLMSKGILFYGPPGNGKTLFAEAIAGEYKMHFIKVLSKDLIGDKGTNSIIEKLDKLFNFAIKISNFAGINSTAQGVVLFFDEFDALAGKNDLSLQVRGTLLDLLTSSRIINNLVIVAATNFYKDLDEACIRKGRFDKHIEIRNPNKNERESIIKGMLDKDKGILNFSNKEEGEIIEILKKENKNRLTRKDDKDKDEDCLSFADIKNIYTTFKKKRFIANIRKESKSNE